MPFVTVVMPVYNSEKYLKTSIESILQQTFSNFVFLIINDGSTDQSAAIISAYDDPRIWFVNREQNCGLTETLNDAFRMVESKYIARMDSDDIAMPHRLERQLAFMEANPSYGLCGSHIDVFDDNGKQYDSWMVHMDNDWLEISLLFKNNISHPSVMLRTEVLRRYNIAYNQQYYPADDYKMWVDLKPYARLGTLPEVLLQYRFHAQSITNSQMDRSLMAVRQIVEEQIRALSIEPTIPEIKLHMNAFKRIIYRQPNHLIRLKNWFNRLKEANAFVQKYDQPAFNAFLDALFIEHQQLYRNFINSLPAHRRMLFKLREYQLLLYRMWRRKSVR